VWAAPAEAAVQAAGVPELPQVMAQAELQTLAAVVVLLLQKVTVTKAATVAQVSSF
jgi:hypothetical protein